MRKSNREKEIDYFCTNSCKKKNQIFLKQIFGQVPLNCCYSAALY